MEWSFETSEPVEADVVVPAGMVEIGPASTGQLHVELQPIDPTSRRAAAAVAVAEVTCNAGKLRVHVPDRAGRNEVRCRIQLPEGSSVSSKTASADLRCAVALSGFSGATASGDVLLGNVEGHLTFKSASADLRCDTVGGRLAVRTASGDVSVNLARDVIDASLASGDFTVGEAATSVEIKSASGDVSVRRASSGRVRVQTASGDVSIGVASGVGARLDVTTISGETTCALPFQEEAPATAALDIVCRTVSGDVRIESAER